MPRSRHHQFVLAAQDGDYQAMERWLDKGADVDFDGGEPWKIALQFAAYENNGRLAAFLLEHGADVNKVSKGGSTALLAAFYGRRNCARVVQLLIDAGADVNYVMPHPHTYHVYPLERAAHSSTGEVVQMLLNAGAAIEGPRGTTCTPLMSAARAGNMAALRVLVEAGADRRLNGGGGRAIDAAQTNRKRNALVYLRAVVR